jgi:hypothetical protein
MSEMPSIEDLANECSLRYVEEFDYKYSIDQPPLNEAFIREIVEIIKDASFVLSLGIGLERIYDLVKKKVLERKEKEALELSKANKILNVVGNGSILLFGNVRPFFEIPKGSRLYFYNVRFQNRMPINATPLNLQTKLVIPDGTSLILQNIAIVYDGELGKFIKEYTAPSVFLIKTYGVAS